MNTFFNSFSYPVEIIFTFGSGFVLLVVSYYALRINPLAAIGLVIFGLMMIAFGVVNILVRYNYLDHSSLITISPAVGLVGFPVLSIAGLQMTKNNSGPVKILKISSFFALIFIFLLLVLLFLSEYL